jgi:hypothetical protein
MCLTFEIGSIVTILYFAAVATVAIVAWKLFPANDAIREDLEVIAVFSFVGGIIGFTAYDGWTKQKLIQQSRVKILLLLFGSVIGIIVLNYLQIPLNSILAHKPFNSTSILTLALGFGRIFCSFLCFKSVGALLASFTKTKLTSEQIDGSDS